MKENAQQKMEDVLEKWRAFHRSLDTLYEDSYVQSHGHVGLQKTIKQMLRPISIGLGQLMARLKLPFPE